MDPSIDPQHQRRTRLFGVAVAALIIVPVVIGFLIFLNNRDTVAVKVTSLPGDAEIYVNDKPVSPRSLRLREGSYKISAKKTGFEDSEKNVTVGESGAQVSFLLTPVSSEAQEWALKNQAAYLKAEAASGQQTQEEGANFENANPVIGQLPYKSLLFSIDYKLAPNDQNRAVLIITADNPTDRSFAVNQIKNWGYNPADYEIEFTGFINPLGAGQ